MVNKVHYKVVYQLESDDPKLISKTLHNMRNALEAPRLRGKLEMEPVAFSGFIRVVPRYTVCRMM